MSLPLQPRRHFQAAQAGNGRIEVEQLDERMADRRLFARHADDQRHHRRFVVQADLGPEIVLAQVVAVIAGEDDDRVVGLPGFLQGVEHFADLRIHVGDGGVVAADRFLLAADVHLHVDAGLVVDAGLGNVVPVAGDLRRQRQLVVRQKRLEVLLRRDERHMRADKADGEKERLAGMLLDQFHGLGRGLAVGVNQVVAIGLDDDERIAAHDRLFAVGIAFQRFAGARRLPSGPGLLNFSVHEAGSSPSRRCVAPSPPSSMPPGTPM